MYSIHSISIALLILIFSFEIQSNTFEIDALL